jgi:hypothetical protein
MNPDATGFTKNTLSSKIQTVIDDYFITNLKVFGKSFRRSNLLASIDNIDPGILNSKIDVTMNQRITPILGTSQSHTVTFPVSLQAADDINLTVTSSGFFFNSVLCSIKNVLGSTKLQVVDSTNTAVVDNVGSFDASGVVSLVGLTVDSIPGGTYIKIKAVPSNQSTITPLRNYVLDNDISTSYVTGTIES